MDIYGEIYCHSIVLNNPSHAFPYLAHAAEYVRPSRDRAEVRCRYGKRIERVQTYFLSVQTEI